MDPAEQRRRAGQAVERRIKDLGLTVSRAAQLAKVDRKTLANFLAGRTYPRPRVQAAIERALNWPEGEIKRRSTIEDPLANPLAGYPSSQLIAEILRRSLAWERRYGCVAIMRDGVEVGEDHSVFGKSDSPS